MRWAVYPNDAGWWFAWRPVTHGETNFWMETVWRERGGGRVSYHSKEDHELMVTADVIERQKEKLAQERIDISGIPPSMREANRARTSAQHWARVEDRGVMEQAYIEGSLRIRGKVVTVADLGHVSNGELELQLALLQKEEERKKS